VRPAVFLDRDGTMIEDVGYLDALDRIDYYPWTVDAIRMLNRAGLPVVVVTNQAGIARGFFTEAFVQETHRVIAARLAAGGARVDAYY
jgi:D-glycero-D-manno-heptose 1,7-bisphosphate phosphatase